MAQTTTKTDTSRLYAELPSGIPPRKIWMGSLLIILAALLLCGSELIFGPAGSAFLDWGDSVKVSSNEMVGEGDWAGIWTKPSRGIYAPAAFTSYALDWFLWQGNPRAFHICNLLIHLANVILLYWLCVRISGKPVASILPALLFGLHPSALCVTANISGRGILLAMFFSMISLWVLQEFLQFESRRNRPLAYAILLGSGLLACCSHYAGAMLPIAAITFHYLFGTIGPNIRFRVFKLVRQFHYHLPILCLSVLFIGIHNFTGVETSQEKLSNLNVPMETRLEYLKTEFPNRVKNLASPDFAAMTLDLPRESNDAGGGGETFGVGGILIWLFVLLLLILSWFYSGLMFLGLLWMLAWYGPAILFYSHHPRQNAELFYPSVCGAALVAFGFLLLLGKAWEKYDFAWILDRVLFGTAFILTPIFGWQSSHAQTAFASDLSYWEAILKSDAKHSIALHELGRLHQQGNQSALALLDLEKGLSVCANPLMRPRITVNLAALYIAGGYYDKAIEILNPEIENKDKNRDLDAGIRLSLSFNRARAHEEKGDLKAAYSDFETAIVFSESTEQDKAAKEFVKESLLRMARISNEQGFVLRSREHLNKLLQSDPKHTEALLLYAQTFLEAANPSRALDILREFENANSSPAIKLAIAECLQKLGKTEEASAQIRNVLDTDSQNLNLRVAAAQIWFSQGEFSEGIFLLEEGLSKIKTLGEEYREHLYNAYCDAGDRILKNLPKGDEKTAAYIQGIRLYEKARKLLPKHPRSWEVLRVHYQKYREYDNLLDILTMQSEQLGKPAEIQREIGLLHLKHGILLQAQGQMQKAIEHYQSSLKFPLTDEDKDEALLWLDRARKSLDGGELDRHVADILKRHAKALEDGNTEEAVKTRGELTALQEKHQTMEFLRYSEGLMWRREKNYEKALACFEASIALLETPQLRPDAFLSAGLAALQTGDLIKAKDRLKEYLLYSRDEEFRVRIADTLYEKIGLQFSKDRKTGEAFDALVSAYDLLKDDLEYADIDYHLAACCFAKKDMRGLKFHVDRYLARVPFTALFHEEAKLLRLHYENNEMKIRDLLAKAATALEDKMYSGAESQIRLALNMDPENPKTLFMLADVLEAKGDRRGALAEFGKALTLKQPLEQKSETIFRVGQLQLSLEEWDLAKATFNEYQRLTKGLGPRSASVEKLMKQIPENK